MFYILLKVTISYALIGVAYNITTYNKRFIESLQDELENDSELRFQYNISPIWVDALVETIMFFISTCVFAFLWPLMLSGDIKKWKDSKHNIQKES